MCKRQNNRYSVLIITSFSFFIVSFFFVCSVRLDLRTCRKITANYFHSFGLASLSSDHFLCVAFSMTDILYAEV